MLWHKRRRALRFFYTPQTAGSGTSVMRGGQLSALVERSGLMDREITFQPLDLDARSSDLFLTKGAARSVSPDQISRWRRRGCRVLLDPVDEDVSDEVAAVADCVVAASISAEGAYRDRWPRARIVRIDHHVDPRVRDALATSDPASADTFVARYFGESVNTIITEQISSLVGFVQVDTSRQDDAWIREVPGANLHYAMRRHRALDRHKPFLKGFTAAAGGANILIGRDEADAVNWLPDDYPYWVRNTEEKTIIEALEHARDTFMGDEWRRAQNAMQDIAARTTDERIIRQLVDAVA